MIDIGPGIEPRYFAISLYSAATIGFGGAGQQEQERGGVCEEVSSETRSLFSQGQ